MSLQKPSTPRLLLRALEPSAISLVICLLTGFIIVAAHALSLSTSGIAYPDSTNDTFMLFYTNTIVQPLASTINSSIFNNGLTVLAWGLVGLFAYAIIAGIVGVLARWKETEHNVSVPVEGVVVRHPLEHNMIVRGIWRLLIAVLTVALTIAILPLIHWCFLNGERLLHADSVGQAVLIALVTILTWMAMLHCYLVLIRLYVLRTRVFGELLY